MTDDLHAEARKTFTDARHLLRDLEEQFACEANLAYWPSRRGEGVVVSGGDESNPTQVHAEMGPDRANVRSAEAKLEAARKAVKLIRDELDHDRRKQDRLRDCTVGGCRNPGEVRSPLWAKGEGPWRCRRCYSLESYHGEPLERLTDRQLASSNGQARCTVADCTDVASRVSAYTANSEGVKDRCEACAAWERKYGQAREQRAAA